MLQQRLVRTPARAREILRDLQRSVVRSVVTELPGHNEERGGAAAGGVSRAAPRLGAGGGAQDSAAND